MTTEIALVDAFEEGTLDLSSFGHAEHVRVAWALIVTHGTTAGLQRFDEGLRRLTAAAGASGRYHATITHALVYLIAERVAVQGAAPWETFARANEDLLTWPSPALAELYDEPTLASDLARRTFLLPGRSLSSAGTGR